MNPAAATARFIAFADGSPIALRDVEDLHDADQDAALADRLPVVAAGSHPRARDAAVVAAAAGLARMVTQPGRAALMAHDLGRRSAFLAAH